MLKPITLVDGRTCFRIIYKKHTAHKLRTLATEYHWNWSLEQASAYADAQCRRWLADMREVQPC